MKHIFHWWMKKIDCYKISYIVFKRWKKKNYNMWEMKNDDIIDKWALYIIILCFETRVEN
jgi:hypothetical protein